MQSASQAQDGFIMRAFQWSKSIIAGPHGARVGSGASSNHPGAAQWDLGPRGNSRAARPSATLTVPCREPPTFQVIA
jgi:hypothetical protein